MLLISKSSPLIAYFQDGSPKINHFNSEAVIEHIPLFLGSRFTTGDTEICKSKPQVFLELTVREPETPKNYDPVQRVENNLG